MHRTAEKYTESGVTYEERTYGDAHLQHYRTLRNQVLGDILKENFPDRRPLRILEVGCGTGLVLDHLSSLPEHHEVCGVDGSEAMLSQARERLADRDPPLDLRMASVDNIPFDANTFDVVVATRFIHLFSHDEKKRIHASFQELLRPGGISVVEFYARPYHTLRYRFTEARKKDRDEFFSHYPTKAEVRDIVGGPFQRRPLRIAGARVLHPMLRSNGLATLTRRAEFPGLNYLVDEYFVVTRKK